MTLYIEDQITTLLEAWHARWGPKPDFLLKGRRSIFRRCFQSDYLWLSILWDLEKPIGGLAGFTDLQKKSWTACITIGDRTYSQIRPGQALYSYSIRHAVENGFQIYDFTRGDEDYKFFLGSKTRFATFKAIVRKTAKLVLRDLIKRDVDSKKNLPSGSLR